MDTRSSARVGATYSNILKALGTHSSSTGTHTDSSVEERVTKATGVAKEARLPISWHSPPGGKKAVAPGEDSRQQSSKSTLQIPSPSSQCKVRCLNGDDEEQSSFSASFTPTTSRSGSERLALRQFQSCPSTPSKRHMLGAGSPVIKQLQALRGSKVANESMFIFMGNDAEDSREITRILPNVRHLSTMSSPYVTEADFSLCRVFFFLVVLTEIQPLSLNTVAHKAFQVCRDLTSNDNLGSVILVFIMTFDVDGFIEREKGFVQELTTAAMVDVDSVLFSFPSAPLSQMQMQAAVQTTDSYTNRLLTKAQQMDVDLQEECKQRTARSMRDFVWNQHHSVFPHIPPEDKKLKERQNGVGNYVFLKSIGEGAFGTVYLAKKNGSDSHCAVKALRKESIRCMNELAAIERELVILRGVLNHPNILKVHDCLHGADKLYIVMEYLGEYSLHDYMCLRQMSHRRCIQMLPFQELVGIFGRIVRAVNHCHAKHICHRDLKLPNIMIAPDGLVTLIDFGLSVQSAPGQQLFGRCGTVPYVAPEVLQSTMQQGYDGITADVWSLVVILIELLCGIATTLRLVGISNKVSDADMLAACQRLAKSDVQQQILAVSGDDTRDYRGDIQALLQGILVLDPASRMTTRQIAEMGVFAVHVGPIETVPQATTASQKQVATSKRLSTESFNSKVVVRDLKRLLPCELDGRPLLEMLGGAATTRKVVDTTFDWLLPRPQFAHFFLSCPVKMGQIRAGICFFLENYLANPDTCDLERLRTTHSNLNISDSLFTEFVDTLIQSFRMQGVRGELVLETTRVMERLRNVIIGGYRSRLALSHTQFVSAQSLLKGCIPVVTKEDFSKRLAQSLTGDMRLQSKYDQLNLHESVMPFVEALLEGTIESAARTVFEGDRVKLSTDQGGNGIVFLFCDNVRQVLTNFGVPQSKLELFIMLLENVSHSVVTSVHGKPALANVVSGPSSKDFLKPLLDLCRGDPELRYFAEMPGFAERCLPSLFTLCGESERIREAHARLRLTDTRFNAFTVHVDSLLRTIYPWPQHPASICNDAMRCLESFRGVILGSTSMTPLPLPMLLPTDSPSGSGGNPRFSAYHAAAVGLLERLTCKRSDWTKLLSTLQRDQRISHFFSNMNATRWDGMMSCIEGIMCGSKAPVPAAVRSAHEKLGITQYHYDCFRECLAALLEPGPSSDAAVARLDSFQSTVTGQKLKKCPFTGTLGTVCPGQSIRC